MPPMGAGLLPKPDDSWPKWLVVVYYIIMAVICLGFVAVMVLKTFKFIKKGHAGIKVRRGQPVIRDGKYVYVGPGIHPMVPFLESIEDISVQDETTDLPMLLAETTRDKKKQQQIIDAAPTWCVINTPQGVHDAIFLTKNLEETVSSKYRKALNRAVVVADDPSDVNSVETVAELLCRQELLAYGVTTKDMGLISVTRVPVQVLGELLNPDSLSELNDAALLGGAVAGGLGLIQGGQTSL